VAQHPGAKLRLAAVVCDEREAARRGRARPAPGGEFQQRPHLTGEPGLVGRKRAAQCRGADGEARRAGLGGGEDPRLPVDAAGHDHRLLHRRADPRHQGRHIALKAVREQVEPVHVLQRREMAGRGNDLVLRSRQHARMAENATRKRIVADRMRPDHLRHRLGPGAPEQAVDIERHGSPGRGQLLTRIEAHNFEIRSPARGPDGVRQALQLGDRQSQILEADVPRPPGQRLVKPPCRIRDRPVILGQHQDEVERHPSAL
jgi:hypothetical protein